MVTRLALMGFLCLLLAACSANRYVVTPYDKVHLTAAADVNPDVQGAPSPIAVRVYELTSRATFDNLDFDGAFHNAQVLLSDELRSHADYVVQPGQSVMHRIELDERTEYIAVVAAYRGIDGAKWKLVYPLNSNWYHTHEIRLNANEVVLAE